MMTTGTRPAAARRRSRLRKGTRGASAIAAFWLRSPDGATRGWCNSRPSRPKDVMKWRGVGDQITRGPRLPMVRWPRRENGRAESPAGGAVARVAARPGRCRPAGAAVPRPAVLPARGLQLPLPDRPPRVPGRLRAVPARDRAPAGPALSVRGVEQRAVVSGGLHPLAAALASLAALLLLHDLLERLAP